MSAETQRTKRYVHMLDNDRVIRSFMYVLQFCIYIPMYLPQAVSLLWLGLGQFGIFIIVFLNFIMF